MRSGLVAFAALAVLVAGCERAVVRMALSGAPTPPLAATVRGGWSDPTLRLWAGDVHFHVSPPDSPEEVHRSFDETLRLLARSGLDFVVLSPHVGPEIAYYPAARRAFARDWRELRDRLAPASASLPLVIAGMEYTNHRYGHATVSFVDPAALLDEDPPAIGEDEGWIYRRAHERGALMVANHPLVTPLDSSIGMARIDLSWRPLSGTRPPPYPGDVAAIDNLLDGYEVYNVAVARLRDRYLVSDEVAGLREGLARLDAQIVRRGRRMAPVGGSDSHEPFSRATTFVAAAERSERALRDGIRRGRVCVRAPAPCALRVFADGASAGVGVGDAIRAARSVELHWSGRGEVFRDGVSLGRFDGHVQSVITDSACHLFRLELDGGWSGPVYVNCSFAED